MPESASAVGGRAGLYPWVVVFFLMLHYTNSYLDRIIPTLLVGPIRADLGISDTQFSILLGFAFVVTYCIAGIPAGWAVDKWSRRGVIVAGSTTWSLMTAACGLANTYPTLLAARIGVGIGEATLTPAAFSLITDYVRKAQISRAMSFYALGTPIGTGLALMIGGVVLEMATTAGPIDVPLLGITLKPWQQVFMLVVIPGLILAALTFVVIREPARRHDVKPDMQLATATETPTLREVLAYIGRHRAVYACITLGMALTTLFGYATNAWYPAFLMRVHQVSAAQTGLILGFSVIGFGMLGAVVAGVWADWLAKRGRKDAQMFVGVWYGIGMLFFGVLGPLITSKWLSVCFIAASCFFIKALTGTMAGAIQLITPNRMRGRITGFYLFGISVLAQGFGPLSVALSTDYLFGYDEAVGYSIALVGAVCVSVGTLCFGLGRRHLAARVGSEG